MTTIYKEISYESGRAIAAISRDKRNVFIIASGYLKYQLFRYQFIYKKNPTERWFLKKRSWFVI